MEEETARTTTTKPRTTTVANMLGIHTHTNNTNISRNHSINHHHHHHHNTLSPRKSLQFTKFVSDLNWRILLLLFTSLFLLLFYFSSYYGATFDHFNVARAPNSRRADLSRAKIAVCLVGGARRFELTGPSINQRVLARFPNADLFLNTPIDKNSFKLSLLKFAPRVKSVRIFRPERINETDSQVRVLTAANSPNGIQGLLQYFNLVEGCLTMIQAYQKEKRFTYDWIVRTRVDGYWSAPLDPKSFIPGKYVVPPGSSFGGLNDRLGVGDYHTSVVALSRLSLIPTLERLNYTGLNSETSFKAQLTSHNITFLALPQPFCIVTDRKYSFPPGHTGVPVAALSSHGPLSGVKCRPCKPACAGTCIAEVMSGLGKEWSWTPWTNRTIELCNAESEWEVGWEKMFDKAVGKRLAQYRKRVKSMSVAQCVKDFNQVKVRAEKWDSPPLEEICKLGLDSKQ